jgi:hypothetical protein
MGVGQAQKLVSILQAKRKLTTLCGFRGDETELDLNAGSVSSTTRAAGLSGGCAVLIANEVNHLEGLLVLKLGRNGFKGAETGTVRVNGSKCGTWHIGTSTYTEWSFPLSLSPCTCLFTSAPPGPRPRAGYEHGSQRA